MSENERIKLIRVTQKLNQTEFGAQIGIKTSSLSEIERGKNAVSQQVRKAICREFNVSEKWLRTGEGEMYAVRSREEELAAAVNNLLSEEKPEFRRRLILSLSGLTDSQWDYLEQFLQGVLNEHTGNSAPETETLEERHERHKREARAEADELYEVILHEKMEQDNPDATFGSNSFGGGVA